MKYDFFRGYVPTKNKKCMKKFKKGTLMQKEDHIDDLPEYAGILNENTVLIDIDDEKQSDVMFKIVKDLHIKCMVNRTTRGKHFFFLNNDSLSSCGTHLITVCGLKVDVKVGCKSSYAVLKFNNEVRPTIYDIDEDEEYDTVPKFILPLTKSYQTEIFGMRKGDGRNETLFSHILQCQKVGLGKDEIREIYRTITNKYVLGEPLPENELETLMRDEAFNKKSFSDKNGFRHDEFGKYMLLNDHIIRLNGELHIYKNGVYVPGRREIEKAMLDHNETIKTKQRTETLNYIELRAKDTLPADAKYIAFNNGVLNIETGEMSPFSSTIVVTNKIPWDYREDSYSELADSTLNKIACSDPEVRALLEECIGYCFYRRNEMSKSFILTGDRSNGKSTFIHMLEDVLGEANITSLGLEELDERFSIGEMNGKLANTGDDIADDFLQGKSVSTFKKLVSGNSVKGEMKGQEVFFFKPYCKFIFSANDIPRMKDKTGAVLRRLIIIPFNATFKETDEDYDPYIAKKLKSQEVMEYLVRIGVEGLKRVLQNNGFTESGTVKKALSEYDVQNNPIISFIEETEAEHIFNRTTDEIYRKYAFFCYENKFTQSTKNTFVREVNRRIGGYVIEQRRNDKKVKIFLQKPTSSSNSVENLF